MLELSPPTPTSSFQASFECGLHVVASYDEDGTESRERREHGRHCKPCCYYVSLRFVGRRALHLPDHLPQTHQLYLEKKARQISTEGYPANFPSSSVQNCQDRQKQAVDEKLSQPKGDQEI